MIKFLDTNTKITFFNIFSNKSIKEELKLKRAHPALDGF